MSENLGRLPHPTPWAAPHLRCEAEGTWEQVWGRCLPSQTWVPSPGEAPASDVMWQQPFPDDGAFVLTQAVWGGSHPLCGAPCDHGKRAGTGVHG